jgi:hypothetical protein
MRFVRPLCYLVFLVPVAGAAPPADKEELTGNAATAAGFAATEVARYVIRPTGAGKPALKLMEKPVLRWSNATRGEVYGAVYLWTRDGCPEAAASPYQFFDQRKRVNIELVSLSETPLTAKRNDKVRWTPEAGVTFSPLPDGPVPTDTVEKRRLQMRTLVRKFTGHLAEPGEADDKFTELRLLATPLHAYEATDESGREGAAFALVTTTDPEIVLLIESRKSKAGREWVWAAARMHYRPLQLKLGDKVVWEVKAAAPPWDKIHGPEGTYIILEWPTAEAAAKD